MGRTVAIRVRGAVGDGRGASGETRSRATIRKKGEKFSQGVTRGTGGLAMILTDPESDVEVFVVESFGCETDEDGVTFGVGVPKVRKVLQCRV